jgi:hypothetical protein
MTDSLESIFVLLSVSYHLNQNGVAPINLLMHNICSDSSYWVVIVLTMGTIRISKNIRNISIQCITQKRDIQHVIILSYILHLSYIDY